MKGFFYFRLQDYITYDKLLLIIISGAFCEKIQNDYGIIWCY